MAENSIRFDFNIQKGNEFLLKSEFCIDANDYLCTHLDCDTVDLDDVLAKTSEKDITDIAHWASSMCDYMNNILIEIVGDIQFEIATEETKNFFDEGTDVYDEMRQKIMEQLSHEVISVEIEINGKIYKGT